MSMQLNLWRVPLALVLALGSSGVNIATAAVCGKVSTFADGKVPLRELHVRNTGNDSSGDGSTANPFATIKKAVTKATAGTAIRVHSGTYSGDISIVNLAGTATAPIWIGGAPGEAAPVIHGGSAGLYLSKLKYFVLHDLAIQYTTSHGINIDDGGEVSNPNATRGIIFRNLNIHDTGGHCLKMAGINDFRILDSKFERCTVVNIDGVGAHDGVLADSTISQGSYGVQFKGGSYNVEVRNNRFSNLTTRAMNLGGSTGLTYFRPALNSTIVNFEARDIRLVGNVIENSVAPAVFAGCLNCVVANNTLINPKNFVFRILQETVSNAVYKFAPSSGGRIFNNIIYFNRPSIGMFVNVGTNTAPTTFRFNNNFWYAYNNPAQSVPTGLPVPEYNGLYGKNPNFLNTGIGSYGILSTSPAARRGMADGTVEKFATGDFDNKCWNTPPSIGGIEASNGTISLLTK